ncbi:MAG: hypothetical protein JRN52_09020 [Nitrososphaerota archaeon]|nr:hypothetical protein [Nitrososphaerota archaeon]
MPNYTAMPVGKGQVPLCLLGSFTPDQWTEELYVRAPPFVVENTAGRVQVIPFDSETLEILDNLTRSLGLVKRKQEYVRYIVNRSDSIKALRLFDWFVRRSWRDKRYAVLWAILYIGEVKRWSHPKISLESVSEMARCDPKICGEIMQNILDGVAAPSKILGYVEYDLKRDRATTFLNDLLKELPTWTEEMVMKSLCSGMGGSVEDVYERIMFQGLGIEAAYKTVERLKQTGYVYAARYYRVNDRGPMREQLAANCRNCFYGYSNEDRCLMDTLRQIESNISRYYNRQLSEDEKQSLYSSIKRIPLSSRVSRRVLESLDLIHEVETMTNERGVLNVLNKIEEGHGIEFPIRKTPKGNENIG